LQQALEVLKARLGDNMAAWRWDQLHTSQIYHVPFDNIPLLRPIFSRARPSGGDWSTVNMGAFWGLDRPLEERYRSPFDFSHRFGPSYRGIFDLSTPDGSRFIQTAGTSGHILSAHYADFLDDWAAGRYRQMRFSRELVVRDQEAVLRLEPQ
jgi:penicillin amidase